MLPKINLPSVLVKLPISKREVRVRAYNVNDEKNLLIAKDAGTENDLQDAILNLIQHSVDDIDIYDLCVPDLITIFINMIDLSKGSSVDLKYVCQNEVDGKECGTKIDVHLDVKNIKMNGEIHSGMISVNDEISVHLNYPSMNVIKKISDKESTSDEISKTIEMYSMMIDEVYEGKDVITEFSSDEIKEWVLTLPQSALEKFNEFFSSMPTLEMNVELECPTCGTKETITYKGLDAFFTQDTLE